jgi:hypothetical protein
MSSGQHSKRVRRTFCFSPCGGKMRAIAHVLGDWDDLFAQGDAKRPYQSY